VLAPPERRELKRRARKRSLAVELVKRAEVILMLAAGHSYREVRQRLDCSDEYIREWKKRFQKERLAGLDSRYRGSQRRTRTAETEARILSKNQLFSTGTTREFNSVYWHSWLHPERKMDASSACCGSHQHGT
jgi:transposase